MFLKIHLVSSGTVAQSSTPHLGLGLEKQQAVGVQQQEVSRKGAAGSELGVAKVDKQPSQIL